MERKLGFAFAVCAAFAAQGSVIVHDAARDLVCNTDSHAVFTNFYGGVWSYLRAATYDGPRTLLPDVRTRTTKDEDSIGGYYVWQRGPAKTSSSTPCFGVNPTSRPDANTFFRGSAYPTIPPGQLSCHPGNTTDAGNQCCVLRFAVPRDGTYEVKARVWNQNTGWIASALFTNGMEVVSRKAWWSSASAVKTNDFSFAAASYRAGDEIELSFDGNNTYNANATGFSFEVLETAGGEVVDANAQFLANKTSANSANPFADSLGTWTALYGSGASLTRSTMSDGYVRTTQGGGLRGCAVSSATPYLTVNTSSVPSVEVNASGKATFSQGRAVWPGEFVAHPGSASSTYLRLVASQAAVYDIGVTARDLSRNPSQTRETGDGVNVSLLQAGETLGSIYVGTEGKPSGDTLFLRDVPVVPDVPLEIRIDNNGNYANDATGIFWALVPSAGSGVRHDANAAMKANMTSAAPATTWTYGGAEWTVGLCVGGWAGAFSEFSVRQNKRYNNTTDGWGETASTSPFVCVNTSGRALDAADTGDGTAGADMLIVHPKSDNSASAIRVRVPETGVYSATAWFKDIDGRGVGSDQDKAASGVDVHVIANGHGVAAGLARSERGEHPYACLAPDRLHLRAGETVTFAVGSNGAHAYDLTGIYASLSAEAPLRHVNVDFNVASAGGTTATFQGAGRVGWSDEKWSGFAVPNGAASAVSFVCRAQDGSSTRRRDGATVTLARPGGLVTSSDGVAEGHPARALFADGVVSSGTADVTTFRAEGLTPGATYDFVFYVRGRGVCRACGATDVSTRTWFLADTGDHARVTATANADGVVTGSFASAEETDAVWCGLQIAGPGFSGHVPDGLMILIQ